jgi:putative phosphoesterase
MPDVNRDSTIVRVGLISDTHGWLDPRAVKALDGERPLAAILHAGDIGATADVLYELEALAHVTAVLGNCDFEIPGFDVGSRACMDIASARIVVVHNAHYLDPGIDDPDVVVCGHTHHPRIEWSDSVLFVNPGSATQRRDQPGCTVGVLELADDGEISARIIELDDFGPRVR